MPKNINILINGKYKTVRNIANGSFGQVYLAVDTDTGCEYAAKIEPISAKHTLIGIETAILKQMQGDGIYSCSRNTQVYILRRAGRL